MASPPEEEPRNLQQVKLGPVAYSGFPVRRLTRPVNGESGEWITAYQAEQRSHLKAVMISTRLDAQGSKVMHPPTNTREASYHPHTTLDASFLMGTCYVESPSDLSTANVSGKGLNNYKSEDFLKFDSIVSIDASDNRLPLEAFSTFPSLQSLELSLNHITEISVEQGDFKHLNFLDLSYNNLSGVAVLGVGTLPALKELHLTGNNLVALPAEMSMPFAVEGSDMADLRFPALERLWLDNNKLCDQATFATLAGLRKLKYLNLNNNEMYTIPRLKLLGTNHLRPHSKTDASHDRTKKDFIELNILQAPSLSPSQGNSEEVREGPSQQTDVDAGPGGVAQGQQEGMLKRPPMQLRTTSAPVSPIPQDSSGTYSQLDCGKQAKSLGFPSAQSSIVTRPAASSMSTGSVPMGTSDINRSGFASIPESKLRTDASIGASSILVPGTNSNEPNVSNAAERGGDTKATASVQFEEWSPTQIMEDGSEGEPSLQPFPVLETLSLVNNLILSSEGVVACGSWPSLKEIILFDNPLTRSSNGMPPLLQNYLVGQLGINVVRKKPQPLKCTMHIRETAKDFKKVSTAPPPAIPRYPLPAIEAPPIRLPPLGHTPHPPGPSHDPGPFSSPSQQSLSSGSDSTASQDSNGIFMTQVADIEESGFPVKEPERPTKPEPAGWSARDVFRARLNELKLKYRHVPAKYRGYEALLEGGDAGGDNIPRDIHGCTKALSYALKHPVTKSHHQSYLHPTSFPTLQDSYLQRKIPEAIDRTGASGGVRTSYKLSRLKKVLNEIKSQSHGVEANLAQVLTPRTPSEKKTAAGLQKEGRKLLAEMQAHYDRVRAASLEAAALRSPNLPTPDSISKRQKSVSFKEQLN